MGTHRKFNPEEALRDGCDLSELSAEELKQLDEYLKDKADFPTKSGELGDGRKG